MGPPGPSAPARSPPGVIDLENFEPTFAWDFRRQGLGLQKHGGPWRTTWFHDVQDDAHPHGWRRRVQGLSPQQAGPTLQIFVDDELVPWSPFSFDAAGDLVITARRIDPAWRRRLWGFAGGWASGLLNTGPRTPHGKWDENDLGAFRQALGYFECEVKCDDLVGNWASFWGIPALFDASRHQELDVVERWPGLKGYAALTCHGGGLDRQRLIPVGPPGVFRRFGAEWTAAGFVQGYLDGRAVGRPLDIRALRWSHPIYLVLAGAVGSGRPWRAAGPPRPGVARMTSTYRNPRVFRRIRPRPRA